MKDQHPLIDLDEAEKLLLGLEKGSRVIYYRGNLAYAAHHDKVPAHIAGLAWRLYLAGQATLVQRRYCPHVVEYIAIGR
jgi:hypothetical protein